MVASDRGIIGHIWEAFHFVHNHSLYHSTPISKHSRSQFYQLNNQYFEVCRVYTLLKVQIDSIPLSSNSPWNSLSKELFRFQLAPNGNLKKEKALLNHFGTHCL